MLFQKKGLKLRYDGENEGRAKPQIIRCFRKVHMQGVKDAVEMPYYAAVIGHSGCPGASCPDLIGMTYPFFSSVPQQHEIQKGATTAAARQKVQLAVYDFKNAHFIVRTRDNYSHVDINGQIWSGWNTRSSGDLCTGLDSYVSFHEAFEAIMNNGSNTDINYHGELPMVRHISNSQSISLLWKTSRANSIFRPPTQALPLWEQLKATWLAKDLNLMSSELQSLILASLKI